MKYWSDCVEVNNYQSREALRPCANACLTIFFRDTDTSALSSQAPNHEEESECHSSKKSREYLERTTESASIEKMAADSTDADCNDVLEPKVKANSQAHRLVFRSDSIAGTNTEDDVEEEQIITENRSSLRALLEPGVPLPSDTSHQIDKAVVGMTSDNKDNVVLNYLKSSKPELCQELLRRAVVSNLKIGRRPAPLCEGQQIPSQSNRKNSWVWRHMFLSSSSDGRKEWHCRICQHHRKYHMSTTNLKLHLRKHNISEQGEVSGIGSVSQSKDIVEDTFDSDRQELFLKSLVLWMARDKLPPSMVDCPGFKHFISAGSMGKLTAPTSSTVYRHIAALGTKHDTILCSMIKTHCSGGFATAEIDLWEGPDKMHYLGVICHFITSSWEKKQLLFHLGNMMVEHTSVNVVQRIRKISKDLLNMEFEQFCWAVCSDNTASVDP